MERNRKRFIAPLLGLAAIIVAVAIYMIVTMPSKDVDMPLDDASPEQVVAASPTSWGYLLARESPTQPWRVFDECVG